MGENGRLKRRELRLLDKIAEYTIKSDVNFEKMSGLHKKKKKIRLREYKK